MIFRNIIKRKSSVFTTSKFIVGDEYKLKMRLIDHVFDDMIMDEVVIKIILPEGAHDIQLSTPYKVQRLQDSLHFTYLDTKGRPVISIKKNNLVENHIQDFEVRLFIFIF